MPESNRRLGSNLAKLDATTDEDIARQIAEDPDTAPELTAAQLAEAEIWQGDTFIRRGGRPKGSGIKELVSLRLDRAVLDYFRAGGPGWQTRINDSLRAMVEPPIKAVRGSRTTRRARVLEELMKNARGLSRDEILSVIGKSQQVSRRLRSAVEITIQHDKPGPRMVATRAKAEERTRGGSEKRIKGPHGPPDRPVAALL
jgi:uncharacterized protein (DUF4415 family)